MNVSTLSTPENELEDIILAYLTAADAGQADGLWAGMVRLRLGDARDWRRRGRRDRPLHKPVNADFSQMDLSRASTTTATVDSNPRR